MLSVSVRSRGAAIGRRHGYTTGYKNGRHLGVCHGMMNRIPVHFGPLRDMSILYIAQGTPGFRTIDMGIAAALRNMVSKVIVASSADAVVEIAQQERPDYVLVLNGIFSVHVDQIDHIRSLGIKTIVWMADDPYFTDQTVHIAPHYDYTFTHESSCVALYEGVGCAHVVHLPFGASRDIFHPVHSCSSERTDVLFIGMAFPNRLAFFDQIAKPLSRMNVLIAGGGWQRMNNYPLLSNKIKLEGIMPERTPYYYSGAKIVVNLHRSIEEPENSRRFPGNSVNPRTFEIAGCGTLQLTDIRPDLERHYILGQEIETFTSPEQMLEKIEYYLKHDDLRSDIAFKGMRRTMRDHTYPHRLAELLAIVCGEKKGARL